MDAKRQEKTKARIVVVIGVLFASFSSIFIRFSTAPPLIIAFYRMFFASVILFPLFLGRMTGFSIGGRLRRIRGFRGATGTWSSEKEQAVKEERISQLDLVRMIGSGLFLGAHFATWITSLGLTSVSSSVVLVSTHPILVFFLSMLFFKEKETFRRFFYILMAIVGSTVLSLGDAGKGETVLAGNLLALAGGMAMGLYLLIGRSVRSRHSLSVYTFVVYSVSALSLFISAAVAEVPFFGYSPTNWILFLLLAVVCTLLGHSLYNWSLKYISSTFVSITVLIEPVAASTMAFFLFYEVPNPVSALGAGLVLAGIYLYGKSSRLESARGGRGKKSS